MKRSVSSAVVLAAVWLGVLALGVPALARPVAAPEAFYQPIVATMMGQVSQTTVYTYDAQLSGETAVLIGGAPYTITTRNTRSGAPIQKATQFAYEFMQRQGLSVSYHDWSACSATGRNVIGVLPGMVKPQEIVLITAHIDDMPSTGVAPGADDNASGSVGVMLAAEILSAYRFERTLRFVFFTGEEQGLCGSDVYAAERFAAGDNIVAVYNLDMIAWNAVGGPTLRLHTRSSGAGYTADLAIAGVFTNVVQSYGLSSALTPIIDADGESASDHASFWDRGYPAILAIEDDVSDFNTYYHTSNDRLANANLPYFTAFVKASVGTAAHLARPFSYGTAQGQITSGGGPVAQAKIAATLDVTRSGEAQSGANGAYSLYLTEGQYTFTVSAYGYAPQVRYPVIMQPGVTTTQNFMLTPVATHTVIGTIRDALTQRPVSATIGIDGYPNGPIVTDPLDGSYHVELAEQISYTFHVSPNVPGYFALDRAVGVLAADRVEDLALTPNLETCLAPGYTLLGTRTTFDSGALPTGWMVLNNATPTAGWRFDNPGNRANLTGGAGGFASADSDHAGAGVNMNTELRSPSLDLTGVSTPTLTFKTDFNYYIGGSAEVADVDVSVDDGGSWANVWRATSNYRGPVVLDVPQVGGETHVRVRFHYYNANFDGWWLVDDVRVGACRAPEPLKRWTVYLPLALRQ